MTAKAPSERSARDTDPRDAALTESFLVSLSLEHGFSGHTLAAYEHDIVRYREFLGARGVTVESASPRHISAFVCLQVEIGLAPPSVNRSLSAVRSFYRHLVREGVLADSPAGAIPRAVTTRRLPRASPAGSLP